MSYLREHDEHIYRDGTWIAEEIKISSFLGTIVAKFCYDCNIVFVTCLHERNGWNDRLHKVCRLCSEEET